MNLSVVASFRIVTLLDLLSCSVSCHVRFLFGLPCLIPRCYPVLIVTVFGTCFPLQVFCLFLFYAVRFLPLFDISLACSSLYRGQYSAVTFRLLPFFTVIFCCYPVRFVTIFYVLHCSNSVSYFDLLPCFV